MLNTNSMMDIHVEDKTFTLLLPSKEVWTLITRNRHQAPIKNPSLLITNRQMHITLISPSSQVGTGNSSFSSTTAFPSTSWPIMMNPIKKKKSRERWTTIPLHASRDDSALSHNSATTRGRLTKNLSRNNSSTFSRIDCQILPYPTLNWLVFRTSTLQLESPRETVHGSICDGKWQKVHDNAIRRNDNAYRSGICSCCRRSLHTLTIWPNVSSRGV